MTSTAPPRAPGWPLAGNLPALARGGMDYLDAQRAKLGDLFRIDAGPQPVVLLHDPEHALHVLRTHAKNYVKQGSYWSSIRSLIGLGLPTIEGDVWRQRRRLMNPAFQHAQIDSLAEQMTATIEEQLNAWSSGEVVAVGEALSQTTMAVIVKTIFSTGITPDQAAKVSGAMSFSLDHMLQRIATDALPAWLPVSGRRAHRNAVAQIDEVLFALIEKRRTLSEESHDPLGEESHDLLGLMLAMRDEGTGLTDQQLRDETMSLFIAGYETTASAVSWGVARLAQDATLALAMRTEVDTVLQGRCPGASDLERLPFCRRFFLETLRLDAPVFFLPRQAVDDDVIGGHHIAAGTMVSLMIDRIHRHPDHWPDPERFDPGRFVEPAASRRHPCAFMAFGAGQRQCIGQHFATLEGVFLLAMLAQRFEFSLLEDHPVVTQLGVTKRPRGGLKLAVSRRT